METENLVTETVMTGVTAVNENTETETGMAVDGAGERTLKRREEGMMMIGVGTAEGETRMGLVVVEADEGMEEEEEVPGMMMGVGEDVERSVMDWVHLSAGHLPQSMLCL